MRIFRLWHRSGVVRGSLNRLGQRWQNLLALCGMEGGDSSGLWEGGANEGWSEVLGQWRGRLDGVAGKRGQHAVGGGGSLAGLPED
jgi:hypothetical protein